MNGISDLQQTVERVVGDVGPSVVGLGRGWRFGSGIVVEPGKVLTSAHNLRRDEITVTFGDGRQATATVAGTDVDGDVAVLAVDTGGTKPVEWAEDGAALGTPVFALANPGGRGMRVSFGMVSSTGRSFRGPRGRRVAGAIEHTAPLPRGSSGGPVVDARGRLLGINTLRLEGGLILALAADSDLRTRVDALARGESRPRVTLGIYVAPPRAARRLRRAVGLPERDGVLVRGVEEGTPAARAGLERGDLIVAAGGTPVTRLDDLYAAIDSLPAETGTLELSLVRGTDERTVSVTLAS